MLDETNCSVGTRRLYGNKEDLFSELKSLMPSVNIKAEVLSQEERIKNIENMASLGLFIKVDEKSNLCRDLMSAMTNMMKKSKKTGLTYILDDDTSFRRLVKERTQNKKCNGRIATVASDSNQQKEKNDLMAEGVKNIKNSEKRGDLVVECGLTWSRVDQMQSLKTLEALRLPATPSRESKTKVKVSYDEFSDTEPIPYHEVPYQYDTSLKSCPPLPPPCSDVKCGMDFCRLGCICQSISGNQKKLLKRDHCSQHQCMFSCHCQHLTRSRASLFENLSPIMDSKFSFTKLNKSSFSTRKQLFTPNKSTNAEESGSETKRKEVDRVKPQSPEKDSPLNRTPRKCRDKSLYNSVVILESVKDANKSKSEEENMKQTKRTRRKNGSTDMQTNSPKDTSKGAAAVECLEISSDSEDEVPNKRRKKDNPSFGKKSCDGFEAPLLFPTGSFFMEHVLIKKKSDKDGSRQDLLVETYHDYDWQKDKKLLSGVFHSNAFTSEGINVDKKYIEWCGCKVFMYPTKDKSTIPKNVYEKLENPEFEYVKAIVTKMKSHNKDGAIVRSPVKSPNFKEATKVVFKDKQQPVSATTLTVSKKCDEVIVVDDDSEEMSDSSDYPDIINKVGSLAPRLDDTRKILPLSDNANKVSPIKVSSPLLDDKSNPSGRSSKSPVLGDTPKLSPVGILPNTSVNALKVSPTAITTSTLESNSKPPTLVQPTLLGSASKPSPLKVSFPLNGTNRINALPSPVFQVPFNNATGISGCRQFRFNAVQNNSLTTPRSALQNKILPLRNSNLPNSVLLPKIGNVPNVSLVKTDNSMKGPSKPQLSEKQSPRNFVAILPKNLNSTDQPAVGKSLSVLNGIKILRMPSSVSSPQTSPLNLTSVRSQVIAPTEAKKSVAVLPAKSPNVNELEGKKIIVLKHVHTSLPPGLYTPGNLPLISQVTAATSSSPSIARPTVCDSLGQPPPSVNPKPHLVSLLTPKVGVVPSKTLVDTNGRDGPSTIEIPDSDEEENKSLADSVMKDASTNDSNKNPLEKTFRQMNGNAHLFNDSVDNNLDSKSVSSHSDNGTDERQICHKRLNILYQEIVKIENIKEKRDKMPAGVILEMILETIKKLRDTNVELANVRLAESETRKKLIKKLQTLKEDTKALQ